MLKYIINLWNLCNFLTILGIFYLSTSLVPRSLKPNIVLWHWTTKFVNNLCGLQRKTSTETKNFNYVVYSLLFSQISVLKIHIITFMVTNTQTYEIIIVCKLNINIFVTVASYNDKGTIWFNMLCYDNYIIIDSWYSCLCQSVSK